MGEDMNYRETQEYLQDNISLFKTKLLLLRKRMKYSVDGIDEILADLESNKNNPPEYWDIDMQLDELLQDWSQNYEMNKTMEIIDSYYDKLTEYKKQYNEVS